MVKVTILFVWEIGAPLRERGTDGQVLLSLWVQKDLSVISTSIHDIKIVI